MKWTRRQVLQASAGVLGGVSVCALTDALTEPKRLEATTTRVGIKDLDPAFAGYRIGVVSDWHLPRNIDLVGVRTAISLALESKPDLLVFPGDLVDHKGSSSSVPSFKGLFDGFELPPDGVLATLGNHDHWWDADAVRRNLQVNTPIALMEQRSRLIERSGAVLALGGVGDLWEDEVDPAKAFAGIDPKTPRILISHNPDVAEDQVWDTRIDLQISGHTHGGEVCLWPGYAPFVPSKYKGKFRAGLVEGRSHRVYVTRGITSPRRVRFMCRPEVSTLILEPVNS